MVNIHYLYDEYYIMKKQTIQRSNIRINTSLRPNTQLDEHPRIFMEHEKKKKKKHGIYCRIKAFFKDSCCICS